MTHPIDRAIKAGLNPVEMWFSDSVTEDEINKLDDLNDPVQLLDYFHIMGIHNGKRSIVDNVKRLIIEAHEEEIEDLTMMSY